MTRQRLILIALGAAIILMVGLLGWRWWQGQSAAKQQAEEQTAEQQANAAALASILGSPYEKIILVGRSGTTTSTYIATTNDGETAQLETDTNLIYSNFLPEAEAWYTMNATTLQRHTTAGAITDVATLSHTVTPADALGTQNSLAVDQTEQYVAWVTTDDTGVESVRLYNLATREDTELFAGTVGEHYSNLTWSPDSTELGFTINAVHLVTVTTDGAEIYNRVTLSLSQMQYVTWLDRDHFGCVLTSLDTNPDPFQPKVVIFDRTGNLTEEHTVLNQVGVPKVLWSADGKEFLFHDPWRNIFVVYDRYSEQQLALAVTAPGKLFPLGWTLGEQYRTTQIDFDDNTNTNTNSSVTSPNSTDFTVTAEDWDHYNTIARTILEQFKVDFSTYRFAATDAGLELYWTFSGEQTQAEMAILQTLLQVFTVIPDVPNVTLETTLSDGTIVRLAQITPAAATDLTQRFTHKTFPELFVINKNNPIGKRAAKPDKPEHHYIGDLVYSNLGDYNPYPALAQLGAAIGDNQFYNSAKVSWLYPQGWQVREVDDVTTLLYTNETVFASPTAWSEFGVTVKRYQAPGVSFEQWLEVNRRDQVVEPVDWVMHRPLVVQRVVTDNNYSAEYILYAEDNIYVIHLERDAGATEVDQTILQNIVQSFSDHYAFQR